MKAETYYPPDQQSADDAGVDVNGIMPAEMNAAKRDENREY